GVAPEEVAGREDAGMAGRRRRAAAMDYRRRAGIDDAPAGAPRPLAPVDVLVVAEERLVEQAYLFQSGAPPEIAVADHRIDIADHPPRRSVGRAGPVAAHQERPIGKRAVRAPQTGRVFHQQVATA